MTIPKDFNWRHWVGDQTDLSGPRKVPDATNYKKHCYVTLSTWRTERDAKLRKFFEIREHADAMSIQLNSHMFKDYVHTEEDIEQIIFDLINTWGDYPRPDMHDRYENGIINTSIGKGCRHRTTSTKIGMCSRRGDGNTNWHHIWGYIGHNATDAPIFVNALSTDIGIRYSYVVHPDFDRYGAQIPEFREMDKCPDARIYCPDRIKGMENSGALYEDNMDVLGD